MMDSPQGRSERGGEEKNSTLSWNRTMIVQLVINRCADSAVLKAGKDGDNFG
jgi:hypothetical protein